MKAAEEYYGEVRELEKVDIKYDGKQVVAWIEEIAEPLLNHVGSLTSRNVQMSYHYEKVSTGDRLSRSRKVESVWIDAREASNCPRSSPKIQSTTGTYLPLIISFSNS